MFPDDLTIQATELLQACRDGGVMVATAESCTGGLIAGCLTEIAGSSDVVDRGFVTYSNQAKNTMLDVPVALIEAQGAVSEPVARAMAEGAIAHSDATLSVAVTGVAGPGGGTAEKPVGLVHLACARRGGDTTHREQRYGDLGRAGIREATIRTALEMLAQQLG
ncbi:MAG: CinA family protein [Rhodospirillaceae bacterium]|jgi:nicotinamide-nucleotide amidase|nr:CinA family protein [Rhodospirillaceae bacterium]MBT4487652.1 CinA family protein [Rhodospirillaceae bacterium]MBT6430169.1 CinA family protein [Rhodospirillaceae bacterium]MBT7758190.1 CinA family protein [Rhodospirillaceae bacterium]